MAATYELVKSRLTVDFKSINSLFESASINSISNYFVELQKVGSFENTRYTYREVEQNKDLILFLMSYVRYVSVKMMLDGTWNWRLSLLGPYTDHDEFLCRECRKRGIDVVVFTTEVSTGMFDIRSELMDVRGRDLSYSNLRIKNDPLVLKRREYEKAEMAQFLGK